MELTIQEKRIKALEKAREVKKAKKEEKKGVEIVDDAVEEKTLTTDDKIESLTKSVELLLNREHERTKEQDIEVKAKEIVAKEKRSYAAMSPEFEELIDLILGKDFTRAMIFPKSGHPFVRLIIPEDKSNMSDAHKEYYKIDKRSIVIDNGIDSLERGLRRIKSNLARTKRQSI